MPRISVDLAPEEFDRLREVATVALRHPRDEARLILRAALGLPPRAPSGRPEVPPQANGQPAGKAVANGLA